MSNKQVFTAYDVYGFKKALALHAAKNNSLVAKWQKRLFSIVECIYELRKLQYPSELDKKSIENLIKIQEIYSEFLADLQTPCDLFISEFEMIGGK